jgi:glucose-6-phosphate 1-dehydrogenase
MSETLTVKGKFLHDFEVPEPEAKLDPFTMVIIGGAGDLSRRKILPMIYHLFHEEKRLDQFRVIGVGLPRLDDDSYRETIHDAIREFSPENYDEADCRELLRHLDYVPGDLKDAAVYQTLAERLNGDGKPAGNGRRKPNILFYLAIPPGLLHDVIEQLEAMNASKRQSKIIVEKPFGSDRESAAELNKLLLKSFRENQIFRIDHYLGKDTVQNMLFFRFGNSIFEPLWNRNFIDHIQITVAEDIGIEHRGSFYEKAGVVRDIVQNHMMQLIALTMMEPPVGFDANLIRDEKVKVFRILRHPDLKHVEEYSVFGQYGPGRVGEEDVAGYRREEDVAADSSSPTYFCSKFCLNNWRWAGVPVYIRTGKRLQRQVSRIVIQFKQPPLLLFSRDYGHIEPNALIVDIQPQETISLLLNVKYPWVTNQLFTVQMEFNYARSFRLKQHPAYERVLIDCINGDLTLFVRQDEIEATWGVVDPIIRHWENKKVTHFPNYTAGSWGPEPADHLLARDGRSWWNL